MNLLNGSMSEEICRGFIPSPFELNLELNMILNLVRNKSFLKILAVSAPSTVRRSCRPQPKKGDSYGGRAQGDTPKHWGCLPSPSPGLDSFLEFADKIKQKIYLYVRKEELL